MALTTTKSNLTTTGTPPSSRCPKCGAELNFGNGEGVGKGNGQEELGAGSDVVSVVEGGSGSGNGKEKDVKNNNRPSCDRKFHHDFGGGSGDGGKKSVVVSRSGNNGLNNDNGNGNRSRSGTGSGSGESRNGNGNGEGSSSTNENSNSNGLNFGGLDLDVDSNSASIKQEELDISFAKQVLSNFEERFNHSRKILREEKESRRKKGRRKVTHDDDDGADGNSGGKKMKRKEGNGNDGPADNEGEGQTEEEGSDRKKMLSNASRAVVTITQDHHTDAERNDNHNNDESKHLSNINNSSDLSFSPSQSPASPSSIRLKSPIPNPNPTSNFNELSSSPNSYPSTSTPSSSPSTSFQFPSSPKTLKERMKALGINEDDERERRRTSRISGKSSEGGDNNNIIGSAGLALESGSRPISGTEITMVDGSQDLFRDDGVGVVTVGDTEEHVDIENEKGGNGDGEKEDESDNGYNDEDDEDDEDEDEQKEDDEKNREEEEKEELIESMKKLIGMFERLASHLPHLHSSQTDLLFQLKIARSNLALAEANAEALEEAMRRTRGTSSSRTGGYVGGHQTTPSRQVASSGMSIAGSSITGPGTPGVKGNNSNAGSGGRKSDAGAGGGGYFSSSGRNTPAGDPRRPSLSNNSHMRSESVFSAWSVAGAGAGGGIGVGMVGGTGVGMMSAVSQSVPPNADLPPRATTSMSVMRMGGDPPMTPTTPTTTIGVNNGMGSSTQIPPSSGSTTAPQPTPPLPPSKEEKEKEQERSTSRTSFWKLGLGGGGKKKNSAGNEKDKEHQPPRSTATTSSITAATGGGAGGTLGKKSSGLEIDPNVRFDDGSLPGATPTWGGVSSGPSPGATATTTISSFWRSPPSQPHRKQLKHSISSPHLPMTPNSVVSFASSKSSGSGSGSATWNPNSYYTGGPSPKSAKGFVSRTSSLRNQHHHRVMDSISSGVGMEFTNPPPRGTSLDTDETPLTIPSPADSFSNPNRKIAELNFELETVSGRYLDLQRRYGGLNLEFEELRNRDKEMKDKVEKLESKNQELLKSNSDIQEEIENLSAALFEEANKMVSEEKKSRAEEKQEWEDRVKVLEGELGRLKNMVEVLEAERELEKKEKETVVRERDAERESLRQQRSRTVSTGTASILDNVSSGGGGKDSDTTSVKDAPSSSIGKPRSRRWFSFGRSTGEKEQQAVNAAIASGSSSINANERSVDIPRSESPPPMLPMERCSSAPPGARPDEGGDRETGSVVRSRGLMAPPGLSPILSATEPPIEYQGSKQEPITAATKSPKRKSSFFSPSPSKKKQGTQDSLGTPESPTKGRSRSLGPGFRKSGLVEDLKRPKLASSTSTSSLIPSSWSSPKSASKKRPPPLLSVGWGGPDKDTLVVDNNNRVPFPSPSPSQTLMVPAKNARGHARSGSDSPDFDLESASGSAGLQSAVSFNYISPSPSPSGSGPTEFGKAGRQPTVGAFYQCSPRSATDPDFTTHNPRRLRSKSDQGLRNTAYTSISAPSSASPSTIHAPNESYVSFPPRPPKISLPDFTSPPSSPFSSLPKPPKPTPASDLFSDDPTRSTHSSSSAEDYQTSEDMEDVMQRIMAISDDLGYGRDMFDESTEGATTEEGGMQRSPKKRIERIQGEMEKAGYAL